MKDKIQNLLCTVFGVGMLIIMGLLAIASIINVFGNIVCRLIN